MQTPKSAGSSLPFCNSWSPGWMKWGCDHLAYAGGEGFIIDMKERISRGSWEGPGWTSPWEVGKEQERKRKGEERRQVNQKRRRGPRGQEWSQETKRACSQNGWTVHEREAGERKAKPSLRAAEKCWVEPQVLCCTCSRLTWDLTLENYFFPWIHINPPSFIYHLAIIP